MTLWDRVLLAAAAGCVGTAGIAGWLLVAGPAPPATEASVAANIEASPAVAVLEPSPGAVASEIVVDVEGGVAAPGVQRLAPGSRVADAIAAAGGYGPVADLMAAARRLNLAEPLKDGQQIYVPVLGEAGEGSSSDEATAAGAGGGSGGDGGRGEAAAGASGAGGPGGGLVDLNTASPEELDALPGIGPVTVQKIVAARSEQPFSSLQDAVDRKVLNRGQLEKIADLASAG
jgi:competence protein ComEA